MSETAPKTMTAEALVTDERETRQDLGRTTPALLETIRAARAGDSAAFEEIMLLTERHVAQIAWRVLRDTEEVKEAVQDTFLRLFRYLGRYDEKQDLFAWLSRIAVNVSLDLLRRRKRERIFDPLDHATEAASSETAADEALIQRSDLALLSRAIDALPAKEKLVILLRDMEGMRTDEVAAALGSRVSTVRVQLSRARVKLRRFVEAWPGGKKP